MASHADTIVFNYQQKDVGRRLIQAHANATASVARKGVLQRIRDELVDNQAQWNRLGDGQHAGDTGVLDGDGAIARHKCLQVPA
jgi:hypothetical protein